MEEELYIILYKHIVNNSLSLVNIVCTSLGGKEYLAQ